MSLVRSLRATTACFVVALGTVGPVQAADRFPSSNAREKSPPTAEEILKMVRLGNAMQDLQHLKGRLRISKSDLKKQDEGRIYPFDLTMSADVIRFVFADPPKEIINLEFKESGAKLTRTTAAGKVDVPPALYSERVRQTIINLEDLSMRFLYWPNPKIVGTDLFGVLNCWKLHLQNPDRRGPYRVAELWVHKGSGGIVKMRAYDDQGKLVKEFKVSKTQKFNSAYVLKQMRVESYNVKTNEITGRTYLDIEDLD